MMKHMVAVMGITAQVRPIDGLYTASAVPTMKPPPTQVAVRQTSKERTDKHSWGVGGDIGNVSDC